MGHRFHREEAVAEQDLGQQELGERASCLAFRVAIVCSIEAPPRFQGSSCEGVPVPNAASPNV